MRAPARAVVIGSGAGGAVTAYTLASAGVDVRVIEEGRRVAHQTYGSTAPEAMRALYRRGGMTPVIGRVPIGFVEGCCVGGSTEINSGFWLRTPAEILERWTNHCGLEHITGEKLKPHFEWAEHEVEVAPWSRALPESTELMLRGAKALRWNAEVVPRAAARCVGSNACAQGCPVGAKQGMSFNLIPRAEELGARIQPRSTAIRLAGEPGRVTGVVIRTVHDDGALETVTLPADVVFVCAGATQTPLFLRRSGVRRNVGESFGLHPMIRVVAQFNANVDAHRNVLPMVQVREFGPDIVLGGAYLTPGHLAVMLGDNWNENQDRMGALRNVIACYAGITPKGRGRIRPDRFDDTMASPRFDLLDEDIDNLRIGLVRLCELLFAAGAVSIHPCIFGVAAVRDLAEARRCFGRELPPAAMSITSVHAFSSCPIDGRRGYGAADANGRIHGFSNLHVNDASMLPSSPGVNPQATIMALARRNALHWLATNQ